MKKELVSVVITTFDRDINHLKRAIGSVKEQTYRNIEIIVVDDNPIGIAFSREIKKYCQDENIIYLKQFGNKGACSARNLGVSNSSGDYIAFLDDDDIWFPSKISEQVKFLKSGYGLVFCKGINVNTVVTPNIKSIYGNSVDFLEQPNFNDMLIKNHVGTTSQIIVNRECFFKVNGFDEKFLARQDYDFCLRISQRFKIYGVDKILFKHYLHQGEQISKNASKSLQGYKLLYKKYKQFYKKNKIAYINICCKISKSYRHTRKYCMWILFMIKAWIKYPTKLSYIIEKACDKKIV